jgi:small subunit ribosomal protein S4
LDGSSICGLFRKNGLGGTAGIVKSFSDYTPFPRPVAAIQNGLSEFLLFANRRTSCYTPLLLFERAAFFRPISGLVIQKDTTSPRPVARYRPVNIRGRLSAIVAAFRSFTVKYTGPKVRISRALGVPLTPKAARIMEKRPYPPGQHGQAKQFRRQRPSPYKEQLIEKQKLRSQYNVHERQMRNYYRKAAKRAGSTPDNFVGILETRLDALVARAGFSRTIYQARQVVNHGHITVNGRRVNIPSYNVRPGDVIAVADKSRKLQMFQDSLASGGQIPGYISVNESTLSIVLNHIPKYEEVNVFADLPKVVEYYAR